MAQAQTNNADQDGKFSVPEQDLLKADLALNEGIVRNISAQKNEPAWMLKLRLKALAEFLARPM